MNALQAEDRLRQLHHLGEAKHLTVFGYLPGREQQIIHDFAAGRIDMYPPITDDEPPDTDHRLRYISWDGRRERDVTGLSDDQFVSFMRSEPAGLIERL